MIKINAQNYDDVKCISKELKHQHANGEVRDINNLVKTWFIPEGTKPLPEPTMTYHQ